MSYHEKRGSSEIERKKRKVTTLKNGHGIKGKNGEDARTALHKGECPLLRGACGITRLR